MNPQNASDVSNRVDREGPALDDAIGSVVIPADERERGYGQVQVDALLARLVAPGDTEIAAGAPADLTVTRDPGDPAATPEVDEVTINYEQGGWSRTEMATATFTLALGETS